MEELLIILFSITAYVILEFHIEPWLKIKTMIKEKSKNDYMYCALTVLCLVAGTLVIITTIHSLVFSRALGFAWCWYIMRPVKKLELIE